MQDQTSAAKFGNKVQQGLSGISETKLFYLNLVEKKKNFKRKNRGGWIFTTNISPFTHDNMVYITLPMCMCVHDHIWVCVCKIVKASLLPNGKTLKAFSVRSRNRQECPLLSWPLLHCSGSISQYYCTTENN